MTSFELAAEYEEFRTVVREFARAEIAPYASQWDERHEFPTDTVRKMGELGLFGLMVPEEFGGTGADLTSVCVAIEEVGRVDQSLGLTLEAAVGLGSGPLVRYGTRDQQERWLPDLAAGRTLAAFGLTEPGAGSDTKRLATRAELVDSEWVINGSKQFITNCGTPMTALVTVAARTDPPDGRTAAGDAAGGEISTIIVPAGTRGMTVEPAYRKLGWHASDTHPLTFVDCRVPADHLLGERGAGLRQFLAILDEGRIALAALAVGCAQGCLDQALEYAGQRQAFGRSIGSYQAVAFDLADLAVSVDAARLLTYRAAAARDAGRPSREVSALAAKAKLFASTAAVDATRTALQVFGGYGFTEEFPIARFYRDAKILEIGEGTSQMQRLVIARSLGLDPA